MARTLIPSFLALTSLAACSGTPAATCPAGFEMNEDGLCVQLTDTESDTGPDTDSDTGSDSDSDTNSDTDSDTSSDTDSGAETTVCAHGGAPFASIQDAINAASDGDVITVCAGTYEEVLTLSSASVSIVGVDGAAATIVDADGDDRVLTISNGAGPDSIIEGLTLTGGRTRSDGGGLYLDGSSPTVRDCIITGNEAENGGGVGLHDSEAVLESIRVSDNYASSAAGGIYVDGGQPTIGWAWVDFNVADYGPGAIQSFSPALIYNSAFVQNIGTTGRNANDVAAILATTSGLQVFNNVFAYNVRSDSVSGQYGSVYVFGTFKNNIVYESDGGISYSSEGIDYNLSYGNDRGNYVDYGGELGANNLTEDPLFTNATAGDYSLTQFSPAIDAGDPSSAFNDSDGTTCDLGIYGGPFGAW